MKKLLSFAVASVALFYAFGAAAQTGGTVTSHAFAIGKGAGQTGLTSLLCASAQIAVGQTSADPLCQTLTGDVTLSAAGVTAIGAGKITNTMIAGMTSAQLAAIISDETGSGALAFATSPTLVTPVLGVASATSINKVAITAPATSATLTIPNGVTLTGPAASGTAMTLGNTETVTGAKTFANNGGARISGSSTGVTLLASANSGASNFTATFPAATDTLTGKATTDTFTNKTYDTAGTGNSFSINGVAVTANTGTGAVVRATSAALVTPALGTPASGVMTNVTGLPLTTGVTGQLPLANIASISADFVIGNFTGSTAAPGSAAIGNCANALTYSTSTHSFGCNSTAGTGTVTSVGVANTYGLTISGSPITTSGNISAGVSLSTASNCIGDTAVANGSYTDGPSMAQGTSGTWDVKAIISFIDTNATANNLACKLWDGTTIISSTSSIRPVAGGYMSVGLAGKLASPAANIKVSCKALNATTTLKGTDSDSNINATCIWGTRIQ